MGTLVFKYLHLQSEPFLRYKLPLVRISDGLETGEHCITFTTRHTVRFKTELFPK